MRAVVQRVTQSSVTSEGTLTGEIGKGLVVLLGVGEGDTEADVKYMADKVSGLRIFEDEDDKMNLSVKDVGGDILVVSQFTLYGLFCHNLRAQGFKVAEGVFQTDMLVKIYNDGPVTILLDSHKEF